MGGDCSSCKCTNGEEEKILIINQDAERSNIKDTRKGKLDTHQNYSNNNVEKFKATKNSSQQHNAILSKERLNEIYEYNPGLEQKIIKIQGLVRKYKDRSIYLIVRNKIRVSLLEKLYIKILIYFEYYRKTKITLHSKKKRRL
jgi:hypothetical protein